MSRRHMALALAAILLGSCGAGQTGEPDVTEVVDTTTPDPTTPGTTPPVDPGPSTPAAPTVAESDTAPPPAASPADPTPDTRTSGVATPDAATSDATTSEAGTSARTDPPAAPGQVAVWPAPGVVFGTPEQAAADFVSAVFGVEPVLGPYRAGDRRSGEIDVLFAGEGDGGEPRVNSGLALRRLPPEDGWFVLFGVAEAVSITSPPSGATVDAGPVAVDGVGRGFEGTVVVSAFPAGDASDVLATEITRGGPFARPEPYSVTLDLTDAPSDRPVALLVRGDTGADGDTGEFSVIPVTVAPTLPEMR